jgi:hypothetical protein
MHAWYLSGTVTSYWSTKRGFRPQQVQQSSSPRPRTWNSTADSSNLFSRELGLLTSFIRRVSVSFSLTLSLPLCLSPPLFPRVLLSDDCCCLVTTISLSLCKVPKTRNSAAWTIAIAISLSLRQNNAITTAPHTAISATNTSIITSPLQSLPWPTSTSTSPSTNIDILYRATRRP